MIRIIPPRTTTRLDPTFKDKLLASDIVDGLDVGFELEDGLEVGLDVGLEDGLEVGLEDGLDVGPEDGLDVGLELNVGLDVGLQSDLQKGPPFIWTGSS